MREIDESSVSRFLSETMGSFLGSINPLIDGVMQVGLWGSTDLDWSAEALGRRLRKRPKLSKATPGVRMVRSPCLKEIRNG